MPVKPEQIKARLKVKYPKANLSTKRIDAIAAKLCLKPADDADDDAIDLVLETANDFISFEDIAREDDRVRTLESNQKAKPDPTPSPAPNPDPDPNNPNPNPTEEAPAWAKKIQQDLDAIKTGNITQTKKQTALQSFEKSEILKGLKPELKDRWVNRIDVNSETPIEDQIKELESEYSELVQVNADSEVYGGPAGQGTNISKPDEAVVNEIVDNLNI